MAGGMRPIRTVDSNGSPFHRKPDGIAHAAGISYAFCGGIFCCWPFETTAEKVSANRIAACGPSRHYRAFHCILCLCFLDDSGRTRYGDPSPRRSCFQIWLLGACWMVDGRQHSSRDAWHIVIFFRQRCLDERHSGIALSGSAGSALRQLSDGRSNSRRMGVAAACFSIDGGWTRSYCEDGVEVGSRQSGQRQPVINENKYVKYWIRHNRSSSSSKTRCK